MKWRILILCATIALLVWGIYEALGTPDETAENRINRCDWYTTHCIG